jgi:hypothetical protein
MSITRKQTATVIFPWSTMGFATIEPRPIHKPIMKEAHDGVEIRTIDGTIFEWFWNGDVIRKSPSGEVTTWWGVPTMSEMVKRPGDGTFCQFYSDGRVTMSLDNFTWFWGPPVSGDFTDGYVRIVACSCDDCVDDRDAYRRDYWHDYRDW